MIALISDIHANLPALEAALADIRDQSVERIYCLGDVVGYGPHPCECLDRTLELDFSMMGNHDHAVFLEPAGFNTAAERAVFWTRQQLENGGDSDQRQRRWEFLATLGVHKFENNILFVHGSPRRPLHEYIFPDDPMRDAQKMASIFERFPTACFVGHSHIPGVFTEDYRFLTPEELDYGLDLGERKVVVNVGSVGQPRDRDPRACYVLLDEKHVTWRRVEYDVRATVEAILEAPGLGNFNGQRLLAGR